MKLTVKKGGKNLRNYHLLADYAHLRKCMKNIGFAWMFGQLNGCLSVLAVILFTYG